MPLEGFVELASHIFLYTPSDYKTGQLVLFCPWLGAADKHMAKYADIVRRVAPNAKVLLLKSYVSDMITSYSMQERNMKPAVHAVCQLLEECEGITKPRILLYVMSNGGINSATHLLVMLDRRLKKPLPLIGVMCDSNPTGSSYMKTCRAFWYSFPTRFPHIILATVCIHVIVSLLYMSIAMGRYEAPEDYWRKAILDDRLISNKRIAYIASKADKITVWRDVSSHAEQARKKGWEVREFILEDTPHCNHISKYERLYVNTVADLWKGKKL
ncbi:hypothetical protein F4811DRAFT_256664 [Daldinia bambusicola]|nr:hypothetical protein F4811DRAFT_256664 [Daldinia bambusicola]